MSGRIKAIDIHAFRGIPDLGLDLNGKSLLLRGENATGKSSIVEAIEFFFTGKISHLEGTRGLSLQRHGPHVDFQPNEVNVEITFDPGSVSLGRTFESGPRPPEAFQDYFQVAQKGTFILRRSQILEFIMTQPADRFRAIGSIMGIEPLDDIELEMMRLCEDLKGEIESKERETNRLIGDVSTIMGKDVAKLEDVVQALNEILQEADLPPILSLEDVDKRQEEMLRRIRRAESIDRIGALNEILAATKPAVIDEEISGELNALNGKVRHLLEEHIRLELSVVDLLELGGKVIEEESMDICPLCEQRIDRESVLARINNRLRTLRDLSEKASEVRTASIPIINKLRAIADKLNSTAAKIESFPELAEEKEELSKQVEFLSVFIAEVNAARGLKHEMPVQEFEQEKGQINGIWDSISTKCSQLIDDIGLTEEEKKVLDGVRLIEQIRSRCKDISRAYSELSNCQRRYGLAEKIYSTFSNTKKAKIQGIYNSIQGDIQSFHSMLHPNEPHTNIELTVALGRRASTEIKMESFGREGEDPRALTSEGHLDSLGLCIFLAFVKKFNEGCSLIVLDDVVTTIDARHRENICKLLLSQFGDKQLVLTTHDGVWYEQLCASQRAYGVDGKFKNLTIVDWYRDTGPIIRPYKPRWEVIQEKVASGDKRGAGNEGRQYLEWILAKICVSTDTHIPPKALEGQQYQVGDLLAPAKRRVEELVRDDDPIKARILEKFRNLEATIIMGNLLSHNNILAEQVSIEEVRSFCNCVHELHSVFMCPDCGHLINYYRNLGILRCSNSRCNNPIEVRTQ